MKTRMLPLAGLFLTILSGLSGLTTAAPAPPAGRPRELTSFQAHRFVVHDLAVSADGKMLASAGRDSKVKVWEVGTWNKLADIQAHDRNPNRGVLGIVDGVAFSPDGQTVASSGDDRKVQFWDVATGTNTGSLESVAPSLLFSPDGNRLVAGHLLWDLKTGKSRNVWKGLTDLVKATAFDDKGKVLIVSATIRPKPPTFTLWDMDAGKEIMTFRGHTKEALRVALSPNRKIAVSAGLDWTVRFWDVATGKNTLTLKDQPGQVFALAFSPDGKTLASAYRNQRDGEAAAGPVRGYVRLYETATGNVLATLGGRPGVIGSLVFSPDGRLLAAGDTNGVITVWELPKRYAPDK